MRVIFWHYAQVQGALHCRLRCGCKYHRAARDAGNTRCIGCENGVSLALDRNAQMARRPRGHGPTRGRWRCRFCRGFLRNVDQLMPPYCICTRCKRYQNLKEA